MRPVDHVIYGSIASAVLYPYAGVEALYFWAGSFLIDIDHYLDYIYHNRFTDFSLKKMFEYHKALDKLWFSTEFLNVEIFHTIEFLLLLFLVSQWTASVPLLLIFFGFVFHSLLDVVHLYRHNAVTIRAYSFTEYYIRRSRLVAAGYRPRDIYDTAVRTVNGGA